MINSAAKFQELRMAQSEAGMLYQDLVVDAFDKELRIPIQTYDSQYRQYAIGESRQGIEVKFDMRFVETGNLYVETAEKREPRHGQYHPSGIYRRDNSWLYVIGDERFIFVFTRCELLRLHQAGEGGRRFKHVETDTSKGFLLPESSAREHKRLVLVPELSTAEKKALDSMRRKIDEKWQALQGSFE